MSAENLFGSHRLQYFAAMNSSEGFDNRFDDVFSKVDRLFVVKGGPGTGKSYLMQEVAHKAEAEGHIVEYYYCSSDPNSLDGILVPSLSFGMLDGTAPHICDPKYPGASDKIVNLGDFWNEEILFTSRNEIHELVDLKKQLYVRTYHFLSAAGMLDREVKRFSGDAVLYEKMEAAVHRQCRNMKKGSGNNHSVRLTDAISMDGIVHFDTYEKIANHCIYLQDRWEIGNHYLRFLLKIAEKEEQPVTVSYDPLQPSQEHAVFLPEYMGGTAFIILQQNKGNVLGANDSTINLERFIDAKMIQSCKTRRRFAMRCRSAMMEGAVETLSEIKKAHFRLEEIYSAAMAFQAKEAFTADLIKEIFED